MIKALKPVTPQLAANETGYLVLLAIFEVVDDTVLVSKSLLLELQQNVLNLATDKFGRIPLLYPFAGRKPRLLPPSALPILQELDELRQATRYMDTVQLCLPQLLIIRIASSKKDPETRQAELRTHFSSALIDGVAENAEALGADSFGCQFVSEVLLGASGNTTNLPHVTRFVWGYLEQALCELTRNFF